MHAVVGAHCGVGVLPWRVEHSSCVRRIHSLRDVRQDRLYALYAVALSLGLRRGESTGAGLHHRHRDTDRAAQPQPASRRAARRRRPSPHPVHDLRHWCATLLYEQGVDINKIQDILGHSSPTITKLIYVEVTRKGHRETANKLGHLFDA